MMETILRGRLLRGIMLVAIAVGAGAAEAADGPGTLLWISPTASSACMR